MSEMSHLWNLASTILFSFTHQISCNKHVMLQKYILPNYIQKKLSNFLSGVDRMPFSISGNHDHKLSRGFSEIFPSCGAGIFKAPRRKQKILSFQIRICVNTSNGQLSKTQHLSQGLFKVERLLFGTLKILFRNVKEGQ